MFEKCDGEADLIRPDRLSVCESLKFAFINTCHSEATGRIFHDKNVQHVICTKAAIFDKTAIYFSENFYQILFKGKVSICSAFEKTKEMLKSHSDY